MYRQNIMQIYEFTTISIQMRRIIHLEVILRSFIFAEFAPAIHRDHIAKDAAVVLVEMM